MDMKRVIAFLDIFEEIPDKGKYLFSQKETVKMTDISGLENTFFKLDENSNLEVLVHFYEIEQQDSEDLLNAGFLKQTREEKIKNFLETNKLAKTK
jgi:hypothetical protein